MPLESSLVVAIDDLEFLARRIVESARTGLHRSPLHGFTAEFNQHRAYRPGDDLRHLDWKLLARTDRLYTKQFRETASLDAVIVLDASASMGFGNIQKLRYAVSLSAAAAWLISTQGDAIGLVAAGTSAVTSPPRRGRAHLRALLHELSRLAPSGDAPLAPLVRRGTDLLRKRGALIVFSDCYDDEEETRAALGLAARRGHDITLMQTLAPDEIELAHDGAVRLADLETGDVRGVDAAAVRRDYRAAMAAFLERTRAMAGAHGIDYVLAQTSSPPDELLRRYLLSRGSQR